MFKDKFIKGIKWSMLQQILTQGINYISIFLLAVLITPEDFGKVALVIVLIGFFEVINGFGISQLIIRDNVQDVKVVSTFFWLVFFLSTGLLIICLIAGSVYSLLFDLEDPQEFRLIITASVISLVINGVNSVFNSLYSRDLDFKVQAQFFVLSIFLGNIVAIIAAYYGLGFWSLIIRNILPVFFLTCCFILHGKHKILFYFNRVHFKNTWSFASNFTYFNAINFLVRNLDYIIIGKFFDLATVGQYSIAYKIMIFPMKNITARVNAVLYPLLTKMKDDLARVQRTYSLVVLGIGYLTFPLAVIMSALAVLWVPLVFDIEKYNRLIILVQILSVVGAVQAITSPVMSLYLISGKTRALFLMGLITALINSVGFWIGGLSGNIYYFAFVYAAIQLIITIPLSNYIAFKLMDFDFLKFIMKLLVPLVAAAFSYLAIVWAIPYVDVQLYLNIPILTSLGLSVYLIGLFLISRGKVMEQINQIRSLIFQKK